MEHDIMTLAQKRFSIPYLRPFQQLAISRILEEEETACQLIILPTGSGKSICFQLPALLLSGITLVIYPLLSLMNDQRESLRRNSISSITLQGGQTLSQRNEIWNKLRTQDIRIIITNIETILTPQVLDHLKEFNIAHMVVDEAHTVCEWGNTFRPAYLQVTSLIQALQPKKLTAFTATASKRIIAQLNELIFQNKEPYMLIGSPDRPNITYHARKSLCEAHDVILLLKRSAILPAIVFCKTRNECEQMAWTIASQCPGLPVHHYHAGLPKGYRMEIEQWFMGSTNGVLCATTAYGMGVSKNDIRTIIHKGIPTGVEAFLQESGRAGRDGNEAHSWILFSHLTHPNQLATIFNSNNSCHRKKLLELMDIQIEHDFSCGGCNVCDGYRHQKPEGMKEILTAVYRHPYRYKAHDIASTLYPEWTQEHAVDAIDQLIKQGYIKKFRHWPVKGRLGPAIRILRKNHRSPQALEDRSGSILPHRRSCAEADVPPHNTPAAAGYPQ